MSTSRTVDVWVSCSVRWTSKSVGVEPDPPVAGRGPRRRRVLLAGRGRCQRPAQVEMERVAELVRLGRLVALPSPAARGRYDGHRTRRAGAARTGRRGPSGRSAGCRAASARAAPRRGSGSRPPRAAGRGRRARRGRAPRRRPAGRATSLAVDRGQVGRATSTSDSASSSRSIAWSRSIWASAPSRPSGSSPPNGTRSPSPPGSSRSRFEASWARSTSSRSSRRSASIIELQLGPLLRAHRAHQRLHRGHPLGQLVDDVVERLGAREEAAVLGQELRGVRVAAADPFPDELVEVADHLAVGGEILRCHRLDRVGHAGHELVEDLALQPLDELVELVARTGLEEVVVLEPADLLDRGRWAGHRAGRAGGRRRRGAWRGGRRRPGRRRPWRPAASMPRRGGVRRPHALRPRSRRARAGCHRARHRARSARASARAGARGAP